MDNNLGPTATPQESNFAVHAQEVRSFRYGDYILEEGGQPSQFAAILSGQVLILFRGKKVRVIGEHDVLGLESLVFKRPSAVSAMALTACRVAFYGQDALDNFLRKDVRMSERLLKSVVQQLEQTTQKIVDKDREFSLSDVKIRFFGDKEVIIEEGLHSTEFYKLVSTEGGLLFSMKGKEIARFDRPGEFFGEMESLLSLPTQATVTSLGQSVVQVYPTDQLPVIVELYPEVALQMIRNLASRLMDIQRRFVGETT
jgi:CRP-like cAMP-binding protein